MIGDKVKGRVCALKLLTDVEDIMLETYNLPEGHVDIGVFTTGCDGVGYVAADDATKKANVEVVSIYSTYGGSGKFNDGQVFGVISGPTISDVENGLRYIRDFTENKAALYSIDDKDETLIYAECIPKIGKYFAKEYNLDPGASIAYCVAPALHGVVGVDEALTVADVEVVKYWGDPTHSNLCGAIFTGTQASCKTACEGFKNAIMDAVEDPLDY